MAGTALDSFKRSNLASGPFNSSLTCTHVVGGDFCGMEIGRFMLPAQFIFAFRCVFCVFTILLASYNKAFKPLFISDL